MKTGKILTAALIVSTSLFAGCAEYKETSDLFENQLYISSAPVSANLISTESNEVTRTISVGLAQPIDHDVTVIFEARPAMAARYNMLYADNAQALSPEFYDIPDSASLVRKGSVKGGDVSVHFKGISKLDPKKRYVLPVTVVDGHDIPILERSRTVYFLFKGAALINVVADIAKMNFPVYWSAPAKAMVTNMRQITVEALLYSRDWVAGRDNALSTVFGIEGEFLVRIGDSDRPRNQLQLVNNGGLGNWPAPNTVPGLPVNEWVHIAVVVDVDTRERIYYINGEVVASDLGARTVPFTVTGGKGVYIGLAFDDTRWMPGQISELRVWNVKRTAEQIAANPYYINPANVKGLVAYWKFNDGAGNVIKDHSGNGTDLTAKAALGGTNMPTWVPVELPE